MKNKCVNVKKRAFSYSELGKYFQELAARIPNNYDLDIRNARDQIS